MQMEFRPQGKEFDIFVDSFNSRYNSTIPNETMFQVLMEMIESKDRFLQHAFLYFLELSDTTGG